MPLREIRSLYESQEPSTPITDFHEQPAHLRSLFRHFSDLRDGTYGNGLRSREEKEALFVCTSGYLDPYARQALGEINDSLLLGSGSVTAEGPLRLPEGSLDIRWLLSWPEQKYYRLPPVALHAFFGAGFLHPHLRGAISGEWPLNVFNNEDAAAELPLLRAIAAAELHNLVFQSDCRIVPAIMETRTY